MRAIAVLSITLGALGLAPEVLRAQAIAPAVGPSPATAAETIVVCVITVPTAGKLELVSATYDRRTGDTTVMTPTGPVRFRAAHPNDVRYAADHLWFQNNHPILFGTHTWLRYGLPRVVSPSDLEPSTFLGTVPLFVQVPRRGQPPEVFYVPVRTGCEFQPYQLLR